MMVLYSFNVQIGNEVKESPLLGTGDITELKTLFPDNLVWKGHVGGLGNKHYINVKQAKALYEAMVKHYAENEVSDEQFPTGNFTGSFPVMSDLQSTFDELITFFEKTCGFASSEEAKKAIMVKQQTRKQHEEKARAEYREYAQSFFEKLGTLKPPTVAAIRGKLKRKLIEYKQRLRRWEFQHPDLAFRVEPGFRDTTFKILVTETVLNSTEPVNLLELLKNQLEKYGDLLDAEEFFSACCTISVYLGTPLLDSKVVDGVTA